MTFVIEWISQFNNPKKVLTSQHYFARTKKTIDQKLSN